MSVHVFPIESVRPSVLGGDSIQNAFLMARTYLGHHGQSGAVTDEFLACADRASVDAAIEEFLGWATNLLSEEPKVLWLSLHGKPPETKGAVSTAGVSAAYETSESDEAEVIDWGLSLAKLRGACPPNVVVLSDVCWGASPTAPGRLTEKAGASPTFFFGPVRAAHRLELDSAAGLLFGLLARGEVPTLDDAKAVVRQLNACFPPDATNGKPFYRVWWWNEAGEIHREPDAPEHRFRSSHVLPSA